MTIRSTVLDQMAVVAKQQNKVLVPLADGVLLLESGLDSLCLAILVATLDDELGVDPFGSGDDVAIPVTVGDLVHLYEAAAVHS
ncbi:MAG TPA: hypothetical protein VHB27_04880 [Rhodopila sp.]|uniref:hypothetical protein n=1 Tax=Rhodopila sp. TaxID=2480087 RepID=UPI002C593DE0|nr:hypothetical protein [Rhodopila sp.]HVY14538.1 hypothetical protein [Rhodopila sp.]